MSRAWQDAINSWIKLNGQPLRHPIRPLRKKWNSEQNIHSSPKTKSDDLLYVIISGLMNFFHANTTSSVCWDSELAIFPSARKVNTSSANYIIKVSQRLKQGSRTFSTAKNERAHYRVKLKHVLSISFALVMLLQPISTRPKSAPPSFRYSRGGLHIHRYARNLVCG